MVKGISVGKCATSPADRSLGRHQYSDAACSTELGAGCVGGPANCRFCQLDNAQSPGTWPVCPEVVCKR